MHLTDYHIHREIMIPNQHLCKQCLTQYAQELDGLHLQSFPLWKALHGGWEFMASQQTLLYAVGRFQTLTKVMSH